MIKQFEGYAGLKVSIDTMRYHFSFNGVQRSVLKENVGSLSDAWDYIRNYIGFEEN